MRVLTLATHHGADAVVATPRSVLESLQSPRIQGWQGRGRSLATRLPCLQPAASSYLPAVDITK